MKASEWSVEQVISFISQLNDNYFVSYVDIFRTQVIEKKYSVLAFYFYFRKTLFSLDARKSTAKLLFY